MLPVPLRSLATLPAAAIVATTLVIVASATTLTTPDGLISQSFDAAFRQRTTRSNIEHDAAVFDTAHLHLSALPAPQPQPFLAGVAIGDRVSFATQAGAVRVYEVVEVRALPNADHEIGQDAGAARLMMVTAVAQSYPGQGLGPAATVRFIIDGTVNAKVRPAPAVPRAL